MRYRRYYTQRNANGSRDVISVGPFGVLGGAGLKIFGRLVLLAVVLGWPVSAVSDNLRGTVAWVVGVPCETIWVVFVLTFWWAMRETKRETKASR